MRRLAAALLVLVLCAMPVSAHAREGQGLTGNKVALMMAGGTAAVALAVSHFTGLSYELLFGGGIFTELVGAKLYQVHLMHKYKDQFRYEKGRFPWSRGSAIFTPKQGQKVPWALRAGGPSAGQIVVGKARTLGGLLRR
jgi:hypothetical protein